MTKKAILFFCLLVGIMATKNCVCEVLYTPQQNQEAFRLLSSAQKISDVQIEFNLPQVTSSVSSATSDGKDVELFLDHSNAVMAERGSPSMQSIQCMVRIPDKGGISVQLSSPETEILHGYSIAPYQKKPPLGADIEIASNPIYSFYKNDTIYSRDTLYPSAQISHISCQVLREIRVAIIRIYPLRYNPVSKELELLKKAVISVRSNTSAGQNELEAADRSYTPSFSALYSDVINFSQAAYCSSAKTKPGCYVFIGNAANLAAVSELIDWKKRRGYDVRTAVCGSDSIPATTAGIDTWIEKAYNTWANKPEYILLVGNEKVIPPKMVSDPIITQAPSDNIFGVIGTSGKIPSIHVGRITGDKNGTSDDPAVLKYIANKIVMHEKSPTEGAWLTQGETWGCQEKTGIDIATRWANKMKKGIATVTIGTDQTSQNKTTAQNVVSHFNTGRTLFGYVGHGAVSSWTTLGFSTSNITSLANGRLLPWIVSIACNVAAFKGQYCFVENMMSEGTIQNPKGALGMFAFSVESNDMQNNQIENLLKSYFELNTWHMGACATYGKKYPGDDENDQDGSMTWGCPEIDIYTVNPLPQMNVVHGAITTGNFSVKVTNGTASVNKALIGIMTNNGKQLAAGFTDSTGNATLTLPTIPLDADSVYVTVTAHNCKPFLESVAIDKTIAMANANGAIYPFALNNIKVTGNKIHLSILLPSDELVRISLTDMRGAKLFSSSYSLQKGQNMVAASLNDIAKLSNCSLVLHAVTGSQTITRQVVLLR